MCMRMLSRNTWGEKGFTCFKEINRVNSLCQLSRNSLGKLCI